MYKEYLQKLENLKGKELKSKRIDLSLIGDLKKEITTVKNQVKKMQKSADNFLAAKKEAISERNNSEEVKKKSFNIIDKVDKAAKDLGVPYGEIQEHKQLRELQGELIKEFQRVPVK